MMPAMDFSRAIAGVSRAQCASFLLTQKNLFSWPQLVTMSSMWLAPESPDLHPQCGHGAFTLVELLVVVVILAALTALLLPAIGVVRENARKTEANQTIHQLLLAMEQYKTEDANHRYPYPGPFADNSNPYNGQAVTYHHYSEPGNPDKAYAMAYADSRNGTAIDGVLTLLEASNMTVSMQRLDHADGDRRLLDPWQHPFHYRLGLSAATRAGFACNHGASGVQLPDWNWDPVNNQEAMRSGFDPTKARPYPYIYSWGKTGGAADPCTWIYNGDTR